jgi:hypothetical protein
MYFLAFLIALLIAEFIIALALYNNSYCGTLAKCNTLMTVSQLQNTPTTIPTISTACTNDNCNISLNVVTDISCVLDSNDDAVSKNSYISFIFAILLFITAILATVIYYIISSKYLNNYMNILILAIIIIVFAFNMIVYEKCMNANCELNMLSNLKYTFDAIPPQISSRCNETNFKTGSVYNFYIFICLLVSITIIAVPIYVYYQSQSKSYTRFL